MKIAIQGHLTRGKEIIKILESLGGKLTKIEGTDPDLYYFVNGKGYMSCVLTTLPLKEAGYKLYTLEEFEKEFPFKIGDVVVDWQGKICTITGFSTYQDKLAYCVDWGPEIGIGAVWPDLLKEYYMERTVKISLEKAREWYKQGGDLKEVALQAYAECELNGLPKSWREFCGYYPIQNGEAWIKETGDVAIVNCFSPISRHIKATIHLPSEKAAKQHIALMQLHQLRDCYRQGWIPNWEDDRNLKYIIIKDEKDYKIASYWTISRFLAFPTKELAEQFLDNFRDLIEEAGDLI